MINQNYINYLNQTMGQYKTASVKRAGLGAAVLKAFRGSRATGGAVEKAGIKVVDPNAPTRIIASPSKAKAAWGAIKGHPKTSIGIGVGSGLIGIPGAYYAAKAGANNAANNLYTDIGYTAGGAAAGGLLGYGAEKMLANNTSGATGLLVGGTLGGATGYAVANPQMVSDAIQSIKNLIA